jgi:hypothetical protein
VAEVNTPSLEKTFLDLNATVNEGNANYIRPLDKEVLQVFDRNKNKLFQHGDAKKWVIQNNAGEAIGRIAAFY